MDLLHFLYERIKFVFQLYDSCISPYEDIKQKIQAEEPPYVDRRNPEYVDEPAFLTEWQDADDSITVIGCWCLCMLQAALHAYLNEYVSVRGEAWLDSARLRQELAARRRGRSWFECFRLLFLECIGIDWNDGPITLATLEQLNLTRNDLQHRMDLFSVNVERAMDHAARFPNGLFTDGLWGEMGLERIRIDKTKLHLAGHLVREFCNWLDRFRSNPPQRWAEIYEVTVVDVPK